MILKIKKNTGMVFALEEVKLMRQVNVRVDVRVCLLVMILHWVFVDGLLVV